MILPFSFLNNADFWQQRKRLWKLPTLFPFFSLPAPLRICIYSLMIAMANYCVRLLLKFLCFFFLSRSLLLIVFFFSFREGIRKTWKQQLEKSQATNKKVFFFFCFTWKLKQKQKKGGTGSIPEAEETKRKHIFFLLQFIKNFLMKYFDISDWLTLHAIMCTP